MICPECGSTIADGASFCSKCGARLTEQPTGQAPQPFDAPQSEQAQAAYAAPVVPMQQQSDQPLAYAAGQPTAQASQPAPQQAVPPAGYAATGGSPVPGQQVCGQQTVGAPSTPTTFQAQAPQPSGSPAQAQKRKSPVKYGLIAAAVVLAIIAGAMFIPGGGDGGGGTDGTPPEVTPGPTEPPEITPGPTEPPEVTPGPTDPDDGGGSSEPMQVEYKGVSFTVPAGWEESQLDDGVSYTLWGDGYYASYMAYSIGSRDSFDADTYLNDLVEQYNYMSDAEVINAQTTSINGYPAAYLEIIYHYTDQPEAYEMIIVTSTPSTELVEISGSCPAERTDCRDELHSIADSLVIA